LFCDLRPNLRTPQAPRQVEQSVRPRAGVSWGEVQCLPVETHRRREGAERQGAFACLAERRARALSDERVIAARCACQFERATVMAGDQLDVVVAILDDCIDPLRS
jgi:hypothetical protein